MNHQYDGFAFVSKVRVADGKAWGSQRFLQTKAYREYKETGMWIKLLLLANHSSTDRMSAALSMPGHRQLSAVNQSSVSGSFLMITAASASSTATACTTAAAAAVMTICKSLMYCAQTAHKQRCCCHVAIYPAGLVRYREFWKQPEGSGIIDSIKQTLSSMQGAMTDNASVAFAAMGTPPLGTKRVVLAMTETPNGHYLISPDDVNIVQKVSRSAISCSESAVLGC